MKLGPGPTLPEALDEIERVGALVGGATAQRWARELREIAAKLAERSPRGPTGVTWRLEAMRLKLACTIAERGHRRRVALAGAKALAAQLPRLAGKAVDTPDALEVEAVQLELAAAVAEEAEQVRLARGSAL